MPSTPSGDAGAADLVGAPSRTDEAYRVEKQIQGWGRKKRQALIDGRFDDLPALARTAKRRERE